MENGQKTEDIYTFDQVNHIHMLNGKKLTGVTTVLGVISKGDGLIQWSANEAVKLLQSYIKSDTSYPEIVLEKFFEEAKVAWKGTRDTAGEAGTDTHAILEMIIKYAIANGKGVISEEWAKIVDVLMPIEEKKNQIKGFLDWAKDKKFLDSERNVYSKELFIGGIVDFVYEVNGEVFVGDIKTSKAIYPANFWQCSAYQFCLHEMNIYPTIKGLSIVRLGRDGSFEVKENYAYEDNIDGFKSALNVYRKLNAITPKKKVYKPKK